MHLIGLQMRFRGPRMYREGIVEEVASRDRAEIGEVLAVVYHQVCRAPNVIDGAPTGAPNVIYRAPNVIQKVPNVM